MLIAQPLACLSVITPDTVLWLIWSKEVQVGFDRVVQFPLELQVTPAALSFEAAWAWVSLVTASACELTVNMIPTLAKRLASRTKILVLNMSDYPQQALDEFQGLQPPAATNRLCASWILVV